MQQVLSFERIRAILRRVLLGSIAPLCLPFACADSETYLAQQQALVREIERQVLATRQELGVDRLDPRVAAALLAVPRHEFVPHDLRSQAYANHPLPIGDGQTISQPYIVAIMSQLADAKPGQRVYELGTGSGYQAAVLAQMGLEVFTVEILPALARRAEETLRRLGFDRVQVRSGDGYLGWPEAAPFAAILVTAAAEHVPDPLIDQLAPGGRLVMPVGKTGWVQQLIVMEKTEDGDLVRNNILPVRFVPITGAGVEADTSPR